MGSNGDDERGRRRYRGSQDRIGEPDLIQTHQLRKAAILIPLPRLSYHIEHICRYMSMSRRRDE